MSSYDYKLVAALSVVNTENYLNPDDPQVMSEMPERNTPERLLLWKEKITSMTGEAQQVVSILLNAPQELIDLIPPTKEHIDKHKLKGYLKGKGWKLNTILKTYSEIIKMLQEE